MNIIFTIHCDDFNFSSFMYSFKGSFSLLSAPLFDKSFAFFALFDALDNMLLIELCKDCPVVSRSSEFIKVVDDK